MRSFESTNPQPLIIPLEIAEKAHRVKPDRSWRQEPEDIESPLAAFVFRNEGLGPAKPLRHIHLGKRRRFSW